MPFKVSMTTETSTSRLARATGEITAAMVMAPQARTVKIVEKRILNEVERLRELGNRELELGTRERWKAQEKS